MYNIEIENKEVGWPSRAFSLIANLVSKFASARKMLATICYGEKKNATGTRTLRRF